jgi:hypothetical protein
MIYKLKCQELFHQLLIQDTKFSLLFDIDGNRVIEF